MAEGAAGIDRGFQQRVAGQAVGAVQAGEGGFADGVQAGDVGLGIDVDRHAAAQIVGGRDDRQPLLGHVQAELHAGLVDVGKAVADDSRPVRG